MKLDSLFILALVVLLTWLGLPPTDSLSRPAKAETEPTQGLRGAFLETSEMVNVAPQPITTRAVWPRTVLLPLGIMKITAYNPADNFTPNHGIAASGQPFTPGAYVACGFSYPFGTIFYIPDLGYFTCNDRGNAISDTNLDIAAYSVEEALNWGVRLREVFLVSAEEGRW